MKDAEMKQRIKRQMTTETDEKVKKRKSDMPFDDGLPALLPPSDDRVFKLLLTHGDAEPILRNVVSAIIG